MASLGGGVPDRSWGETTLSLPLKSTLELPFVLSIVHSVWRHRGSKFRGVGSVGLSSKFCFFIPVGEVAVPNDHLT